ncbi:uncharacterized protein [Triticum aestivum]|uniref:uncharacterized protein isoform X2 n=1 Tax=Triticum aestivum TaxID=4565 RepID=UPI001D029983|nr:uncharacterized protein LOC123124268 isoform X2 [Triticum aestivum]
MADDELEQEQEQELVVPEADERSRWIARHPVGCAGVSLVCIYCHLVTDDPPLTLLILLLGLLAVFVYDLAWLYANDRNDIVMWPPTSWRRRWNWRCRRPTSVADGQ